MPLEDVDFMRAHAVKTSYAFLVDSADRDRATDPTPAKYVVNFTAPFTNVIGLDVLDASIPRTMYNVDTINNTLSFFIHTTDLDPTTITAAQFTTATVDVGDYTIQTLLPAVNAVLTARLNADGNQPMATITMEAVSTPPDVKSTVRFHSAYPFYLDMNVSTMAETLGFDEYKQESQNLVAPNDRLYTTPSAFYTNTNTAATWVFGELQRGQDAPTTSANAVSRFGMSPAAAARLVTSVGSIQSNPRLFHSVDISNAAAAVDTITVFNGPRGVILSHQLTTPLAQQFTLSEVGILSQVNVAIGAAFVAPGAAITFDIRTEQSGQSAPDMAPTGLVATGTIAVSSTDGSLSDSNPFTAATTLAAATSYWLVIHADASLQVFYNDVPSSTTPSMLYLNNGTWTSYDQNDVNYSLSATIRVRQPYHVVTAPGVYSLIGDRYLIMRCPEIEHHSYRSLAYSQHSLGLAKFRLGVMGYSDNRVDFNTAGREFHPLGKLSRITLRFERSNGDLYNFRGANHTITFSIKYMEARQSEPFIRSVLNPNYNPDMVQYLTENGEEAASEDHDYDYDEDDGLAKFHIHEREALDVMRERGEPL